MIQQQTASQKINGFSLQYNFSCLSKNWSIFIWSDHGDLISQSLNCHDPLSFISLKIWRKCEALLIQSLQLHLDQRLMTDVERGVENKISVLDQYQNKKYWYWYREKDRYWYTYWYRYYTYFTKSDIILIPKPGI